MNKQRRRALKVVMNNLHTIKNKAALYVCINDLENLKDEEQDYYDNMPENLQSSFRAEMSEEAIDNMDEALQLLNDVYDDNENIEQLQGMIQDAIDKIYNATF